MKYAIGYISRVMLRSRIWAFCGAAGFLAVACGGIDESDLFAPGGGTTSHVDAGGTGGTDSGTRDSGSDASIGVTDSGIHKDSGVIIPPTNGIFCGDDNVSGDPTYCTGGDICCVTGDDIGAPSYACGAESSCKGPDDLVVPCDNSAECDTGKICCGTFMSGAVGYYTQVRCASSCAGTPARRFCDPKNGDADCSAISGSTCGDSSALPGFSVCTVP